MTFIKFLEINSLCNELNCGIEGLKPTLDLIKYTKVIAIANKESIICGWNLIDKQLKNLIQVYTSRL